MGDKIVAFRRNRESAAALDWQAVADPIARLILTADHLRRMTALPDAPLITLGEVADYARNALVLNQQVLKTGWTPAIDDGIERLARDLARRVGRLDGYVHAEYVAFMQLACEDLLAAVVARRAGRLGAEGLLRRRGSQ